MTESKPQATARKTAIKRPVQARKAQASKAISTRREKYPEAFDPAAMRKEDDARRAMKYTIVHLVVVGVCSALASTSLVINLVLLSQR